MILPRSAIRRAALGATLTVAACSVTPLTGKIDVGTEGFVVVVGEGPDGETDLFAAPAGAGSFYRLTFTRVAESRPRLGPTGTGLAFFRSLGTETELAVLDLSSMGEQLVRFPGAGERIGWMGSDTVVVRSDAGVFLAPLGHPGLALLPVTDAGRARADSALAELLGDPVFAMVGPCRRGPGLCALAADTVETRLGEDIVDPIRWGPEAIGYLRGGRLEVRSLGGGRPTHPNLVNPPAGLRQPTHHPGSRGVAPASLPADARPAPTI